MHERATPMCCDCSRQRKTNILTHTIILRLAYLTLSGTLALALALAFAIFLAPTAALALTLNL